MFDDLPILSILKYLSCIGPRTAKAEIMKNQKKIDELVAYMSRQSDARRWIDCGRQWTKRVFTYSVAAEIRFFILIFPSIFCSPQFNRFKMRRERNKYEYVAVLLREQIYQRIEFIYYYSNKLIKLQLERFQSSFSISVIASSLHLNGNRISTKLQRRLPLSGPIRPMGRWKDVNMLIIIRATPKFSCSAFRTEWISSFYDLIALYPTLCAFVGLMMCHGIKMCFPYKWKIRTYSQILHFPPRYTVKLIVTIANVSIFFLFHNLRTPKREYK